MVDEQVLSDALEQPEQAEAATAEKMLSQADVKRIAAREKQEGILRGRREAEEQYQRQLAEIQNKQGQRNEEVPREMDANAMYQQLQERFNADMEQKRLEAEIQQVANSYLSKVESGRKSYQDFDEITKGFDPRAFPQLVYLVSGIENAGDVIYELSKNPQKLITLNTMAEKSPGLAESELQKLSLSIKNNQQASSDAGDYNVNQPLDQLQPSRVSAGNGKQTISDLRNQPWLRG